MSAPTTHVPDAQQSRGVPSLGAQLKLQRERRGITLEQISQTTKIGTRFLQALEEDHFQQLPGGIFNKGFIRAHARCVGIDEDQAVADYLAATGATLPKPEAPAEGPPIEIVPRPARPTAANFPWGVFATLLLIAAFGVSLWGFYSWVTGPRSKEAARASVPSANQPVAPPQTSPPASLPTVSAGQPVMPAAANSTNSPLTAGQHDIVLQITAREDAWVSTTVDGEVTTEQTLTAASAKTIRAHEEIVLKAGNIGALDFEFRGKPLPTQGKEGEVKTLVFDANGWHTVHKPTAPPVPTPAPESQP